MAHPFEMKPERLAKAIFTSSLHMKNSVKENNFLKCLLKKHFYPVTHMKEEYSGVSV